MIGPWLEALRVPAVERVLIVGAGISGLTLGIALRQAGITVDILELRRDVGQQAGVGLAVQGNALAALARLGLAATCIEHGVPADYLNIRSADGALVARQPILPMGGASLPANLGISRTVLHRILLEAAAASGVVLRPGVTSECVTIDQDGVDARLTDGTVIRAGLLIGADGLYSKTRAHVYPELSPRPCGQAVWRAAVPRPQGNLTTELHFGGPLGTVGICPIAPDAAYIFVVETAPAGTHYAEADLAGVLLEKLQDYTGDMVRECIAHLAHSPAISYRPLEWLLAPAPWHRGRVVVLGDAAHANPPVLAQGAAMGIEDAVVLAELLAETVALGSQLDRFAARRHARAGLVVRNSVQLCEWEVNRQVGPREVARVMIQTQQALSLPF